MVTCGRGGVRPGLVGGVLVLVRHLQVRTERQTETVLSSVDGHLEAISASVAQAVDRVLDARSARPQLLPTLDFDALVESLLAEAAARTGADAVVLRVKGPGGEPVVASFGADIGGELLERSFGPPDARPFRAATVDWTYAPPTTSTRRRFAPPSSRHSTWTATRPERSPCSRPRTTRFARSRPARSRRSSRRRGRPRITLAASPRSKSRTFVDPALGVPDRRGYERELERAVARARRTGRPLTVAIVALDEPRALRRRAAGIGDLARLVTRSHPWQRRLLSSRRPRARDRLAGDARAGGRSPHGATA